MEAIVTKKDIEDVKGMTIPAGTTLFIHKEMKHPMSGATKLIVFVDNGTGMKDLMPKTLIDDIRIN